MSTELNETQHQAIIMLATGKPASAVAVALNIRKETISRWKQLPEFRAEINTLIEDIRESARNKLAGMLDKALEVIEADLLATDNPARRNTTAFKILQLVGTNSIALPAEELPMDADLIERQNNKKRGGFSLGF